MCSLYLSFIIIVEHLVYNSLHPYFSVKIKRFNEIFPDAYFIFWGCFRRNMFFECITSFIYLFIIIVTVFMVLSHLKEIFSDLF